MKTYLIINNKEVDLEATSKEVDVLCEQSATRYAKP